jgi:hypothetical protein
MIINDDYKVTIIHVNKGMVDHPQFYYKPH